MQVDEYLPLNIDNDHGLQRLIVQGIAKWSQRLFMFMIKVMVCAEDKCSWSSQRVNDNITLNGHGPCLLWMLMV